MLGKRYVKTHERVFWILNEFLPCFGPVQWTNLCPTRLKGVTVKGLNDPFLEPKYMAYLLTHDSTHGAFKVLSVKVTSPPLNAP